MAQSGYTPILIYASGSTGNTPSASNLTSSASGAELALNYFDGKLFYKDASGNVQVLASKAAASTTISFGTTGLTPSTASTGAITVAGTLITSNGGTGLSSYTAGDLPYYASGTALSKLAIGTSGYVLTSSGTAPQWTQLSTIGVTTFSAGTTGFTPSSATSGAVTLAGTLATTNGGTGLTSFTANQVFYASSTSAFAQSTNLQFNGTTLTTANDASIHGLTVGLGGGSVATNTAVGVSALAASATGGNNSTFGYQAGTAITSGTNITAIGAQAALTNTTGDSFTAIGSAALYANTSGSNNVAVGNQALRYNTTASNNTAVGYQAGYSNTGSPITAMGYQALYTGTTVGGTTAIGNKALYSATTGGSNTALGDSALYYNTTASNNTAVGYQAGYSNQTGAYNLYLGYQAGYAATGSYNTFVGSGNGTTGSTGGQITSGSKNTILGGYNGNQGGLDIRTSSNYIVLSDGDGNPRGIFDNSGNLGLGVTPASWSGRTAFQVGTAGQMNYGAGISNGGSMAYGNNGYWNGSADKAISNGYSQIVALNDNGTGRVIILTTSGTSSAGASISYTAGPYVSAGGTSWTNSSDERLKNITGLIANGLESVNTLRAARYTWKDDSTNKPKVGLIAQDVQKVLPEVIETFTKYNSEDTTEYLGVTYTEVIPLLVAAIQELSAKVTALEAKVA